MATAFAIYCADDNSLMFYKRDEVPSVGSTFNNKIVTEIYTDFETKAYNRSQTPWNSHCAVITSVNFCNEIAPIYTNNWFYGFTNLTSIDITNLNIFNITSMTSMFSGCSSLTSLDVSDWNTSNVTNMDNMFYNCSGLTSLDVSNWNTSNVKRMDMMFSGCSSLTSIDVSRWNTSSVKKIVSMFNGCRSLTELDVSNFDTSNVTSMSSMFSGCSNLIELDVSNFDTSNVTSMSSMFYNCSSLKKLDVSNFDTSNVTSMDMMFRNCNNLTSLNIRTWNTFNVTSMSNIFDGCKGLTSLNISGWDTSNVSNISGMFRNCVNLITIYVSNLWSTNVVTDSSYMFTNCTSIIGAVPFDSTKTDIAMANYETGYLTLEPEDMLIKYTTLYDLADKIRVLSGTSDSLNTTEMNDSLDSANHEIDTQTNLIAQISSALTGMSSGSTSGGSNTDSGIGVEMVTGTLTYRSEWLDYFIYYNNGTDIVEIFVKHGSAAINGDDTISVPKNSMLIVYCPEIVSGSYNGTGGSAIEYMKNNLEEIVMVKENFMSLFIGLAIYKVVGDFNLELFEPELML